jgi:protein involved in polysaccharide export with SLBB domain
MSGSLPAAAATMTLNPTIPAANDALGPPPYAYSPNAQQPTVGYTRPQAPRTAADRLRHRPNPYANVPSLYDMYTQVAPPSAPLQRFGADVFRNGTGNFYDIPMDVPVGPDYVLGPGDGLKLDLWGGVSQRLIRTVDREGRIALPEVGTVLVAGRSLGSVQRDVQTALRTQFRDVQADVSLARLRTVRVYVEGDVERPGAYDISALSTPLNAVYTAGGPTDAGSYRIIRHFRGKQLLQEVDSYDLLLHGVRGDIQLLQSGDTILVPPVGAEVTVEGMVRRPAIYELHGEKNLSELLEMAGGVMSTGTLRHVQVERVVAHQRNTMLSLDVPETNDAADVSKTLEAFNIQDGDKVRVSPILPYSYQTVYLDGHVFHPGKYSWHEGMKVSDLVKSYNDLLPEPSQRHAEIIRLQAPDYRPQVIAFNLGDALSGHASDPALQPFDTVRVFSRYAFEDPPVVSVGGEVRDPGQHLTNGETHLRDAVYLAGGLTPDASTLDAQVLRHTQDGKMQVFSVNLAKALAGDEPDNILLQPRDSVIIHRNLQRTDPATVSIQGEVANPGKYPLGEEMTASELVKVAGGFKRSAYTAKADLSRYDIEDGKKVVSEHQEVLLAKAIAGEPDTDVRLRDGDVLTVRQLSGWKDIGASITVNGEVAHPGTYGIQEGERLSSILKRAGGFRTTAYPAGAVLERVQVREISEKTRAELIRKIEAESMNIKPGATSSPGEQAAMLQASMAQKQQVLANLKSTPPSGRLVIHIPNDMSHWENTPADPEVRAGDVLVIPKRPNFVVITGQVYNPAAIGYTPHKNAGWYLRKAGGATELANKKSIFIVRADGSVIGNTSSGFWKGSTLSTIMMPGDTIVVPDKILGGGGIWRNLLATAQLASSVSIAASVLVNAGL